MPNYDKGSSKKIVVDFSKCAGCRLCEIVCSFFRQRECNPSRSRIRIVKVDRVGVNVPIVCLHCEDPPCMDVCPVKAISRDPQTGIVRVRTEVCIGCRKCIFACPFGAVFFNVKERMILKCDLCGGDPRCVKFCETGAIRYRKASTVEMKKMVIVMRSVRR